MLMKAQDRERVMNVRQRVEPTESSVCESEVVPVSRDHSRDRDPHSYDDCTVHYYSRRDHLLADTFRTEWWMVVAVLILAASVAFVVL